jgi:uncharacterized protein YkwD
MIGSLPRIRSWLIAVVPSIQVCLGICGPASLGADDERSRDIRPFIVKSGNTTKELDPESARDALIEEHNRIRKEHKLSTLTPSKRLQTAAEMHARDMARRSTMTHEGSDGSRIGDRAKAQHYDYRRVGENIAKGRFTIEQVMTGWINSEVHRNNILGSFSQIGAAIAFDEGGTPYWCITFGLPRRK